MIASFDHYAGAEGAVDHLSEQKFPVERVAIVGRDLALVEQVTGRLNFGGAAVRGAAAGAVTGAFIGWLFGLLNWLQPLVAGLVLALYGVVFGAAAGAIIGLIMHAAQGGRRDFRAESSLQPAHYDVLADAEVADEAIRVLSSASTSERDGGRHSA